MQIRSKYVQVLAVLLLVGPAALGAEPHKDPQFRNRFEGGIFAGLFMPDADLSGSSSDLGQIEPLVGIRVDYIFAARWAWLADLSWSDFNVNRPLPQDVETLTARTGVEYFLRPHWRNQQWRFSLGGGQARFSPESSAFDSFDRLFVSVGVGQRLKLDDWARLRWELRVDRTLDDDGLGGGDLTTPQFLLGISWGPPYATDSDSDGVKDRKDECPDTPHGAVVDARGCPVDSDQDGVYDGIDECPDTPRGAIVDARGCPRDSDGDGVFDGIDECPDTPRGAVVDARGCPRDSDGDGVFDGIDECPDTPRGAVVDARGCPRDSDGDGVFDGIDECPDTPRGTVVDARGCPPALPTKEQETIVLEGVQFCFGSAELNSASSKALDRVADALKEHREVRVEISGHTDSVGTAEYNLRLSSDRVQAVRSYLLQQRIASDRLEAKAYGESRPTADNSTEAGRALNRRVELRRLD